MNEKKYLLDDSPASARDIIESAASIDDNFADSFVKSTSEAAAILRANGNVVTENPNFKED